MRARKVNIVTVVVYALILAAALGTSIRRVTAHTVADETARFENTREEAVPR